MKTLHRVLCILVLAVVTTATLHADEKAAAAGKIAEITKNVTALQSEKKFEEARAELSRIDGLPGATASDREKAALAIAGTWTRERDFEKAAALYAELADSKAASPESRLQATHGLFSSLQSQKKHAEARALYLKALETPDLNAAKVKARFLFNIAKTYEDEGNYEKSGELHSQIIANADFHNQFKIQSLRNLGKRYLDTKKFDEARAEYARIFTLAGIRPPEKADAFLNLARTYELQRDFEKARLEYGKAMKVDELDDRTKGRVLASLARTFRLEGNLAEMKRGIAVHREFTQAPDLALLREYALLAALQGQPAEEEEAWKQILETPELSERLYNEAAFKLINLLVQRDNLADAKKLATQAAASPVLNDEQKFLAALLTAGFEVPEGGNLDFKKIPPPASLDPEKELNAYLEAGKVFMLSRAYGLARSFSTKADSLLRERPEYVYPIQFMERAPFGVSGWQSSQLVKEASRREARFEKYNQQAADLLINDVNVARTIGESEAEAAAPLSFFMAADRRGWHIYVEFKDEEVDSVLANLVRGDSLELFFAPGKGECYFQWMMSIPSGKTDFVPWMSPHRNYRKMDDYFTSEVAPIEDGFGVYMMIPWDLVYDKLPEDGERWPFGIINFGRRGGFTWGGGQVHELNRFGEVEFSGVDQIMPEIRRMIVMKSFAKFKESSTTAARFWNDEVKGDREFYENVLLPEIEAFNELGKRVTPEIVAADVDMLFAEAVADWMEFDYLVSELRAGYLEDKLFANE